MNIRLYNKSDLNTLLSWYRDRKQFEPCAGMFTEDSTFILEENGKPLVCLSVYLTNSKDVALLEHLVSAPDFKGAMRNECIKIITDYVEKFTKELGYKRLITLIDRESLKNKYTSFGYVEMNNNVSMFMKELV